VLNIHASDTEGFADSYSFAPNPPNFLEKELGRGLGRPVGFLNTATAFTPLAQASTAPCAAPRGYRYSARWWLLAEELRKRLRRTIWRAVRQQYVGSGKGWDPSA
jgi:hypothetical protein